MFISTPSGRNWFYDVFQLGQTDDAEWKSWHFTTKDNETIDPKEIEAAQKTLSSFAFKQEYMASFSTQGSDIFKEEWIKYGVEPQWGSWFIAIDCAGFEEEMEMGEEEEEIDIENMSEDDLKKFIEGVIADMVAAGELEGEMEGEEEGEEGEGEEMEASEEEEISIDELMAGLDEKKKYGGNKGDVPAAKRGDKKDTAEEEGVEDYKKKVKEMEEKLEEAYAALETVKSDLNEVNLLNAKLLYTNKIFRAKNLTESQKVKVLEAFDKATTVKETKLVFETLSGEMKEKKSSVNESMIGGASKIAGVAPTKKPILEVNDQFARWQTLAGIKK